VELLYKQRWFPRDKQDLGDNESNMEDTEITTMTKRLKFNFMNPFQKWSYAKRRRFPWKLLVQIISIFLITLQLVLFVSSKFSFTSSSSTIRRGWKDDGCLFLI